VQKILHIPQRERKPHIHHNGQADDLWAHLKVTKAGTFCHPATLIARPARLKQVSSDSAIQSVRWFQTAQPKPTRARRSLVLPPVSWVSSSPSYED
jgi:hypothetical protein